MASRAILTAVQPASINGLSGSSLNKEALGLSNLKTGAVVAKYGDKSVFYFDLENFGNTTGLWDLFESDPPSPYKSLQVVITLAYFSTTAPGDVLPVNQGPQPPPKPGPHRKYN